MVETNEKSVCLDEKKKKKRKEEKKLKPEAGEGSQVPARRNLVFKHSFPFINGRICEIYRMAGEGEGKGSNGKGILTKKRNRGFINLS